MKTQTKSVFVLVLTLIVGIAIGAVSWSIVHNERMERLRDMRREGGLYGLIDRYTDPVDASQETVLREVGQRYQDRLEEIYGVAHDERNVVLDSMRAELRTILTPAQQAEMASWLNRNEQKSTKSES